MSDAIWRVILDTNTLVSAVCFPGGTPARVVERVLLSCTLLVSRSTLLELKDVLERPKFDRYVSRKDRDSFFRLIVENVKLYEVVSAVDVCRDPKDNKFLALAIEGKADILVTGDNDLLALHPFGDVKILRPADFLAL